jgi:hypothetical protein
MAIKARENYVGAWAFLMGVILAVIIGLSTTLIPIPAVSKYSSALYGILAILGLIVGFMNVGGRDSQTFLIAGAVLVIVSGFGMDSVSGSLIGFQIAEAIKTIFGALLALFVPATIVVALKTVFNIANV